MCELVEPKMHPIVFLDFDDVVVLNRPGQFSGYDVISQNPPPELWTSLFHPPAKDLLLELLSETDAKVVITTSWLKFMMRDGFERLFSLTGLRLINERLHIAWEAPQNRNETRAQAIDRWLSNHHEGEPYVILDDEVSGTGLSRSIHKRRGRVVLCKQDVGLLYEHLAVIRSALSRPCK